MQIATDLAHGLDYVHNSTGLDLSIVHNHIKSSSIIVTEISFKAKICHFGMAQLCGETDNKETLETGSSRRETEIEEGNVSFRELNRSDSRDRKFEALGDYMSPEFRSSCIMTQKSDVYAFGVVILELLSGKEPLKYRYDKRAVEVAEKLIRLALGCVHVDPDQRPDMGRVAGKISKLYLESRIWSDQVKLPTGISVSLSPR
ncbi:kiwellin-like [Hibiscus syriacus]|uniref:Kiwellin-like n=1 Tax=Hibiscus syriacus TaxID=106335 RepID=A0A6A2X0H2_HIBSY|nr:kiwellin-like [Hibiscus syriacus]